MNYPFLTQKERDNETGLDYFGARYYSSSQGRFTSSDPVLISKGHTADPQRWNLFSYVENNPLTAVDPTGRSGEGQDSKRTITVFLNYASKDLDATDSRGQRVVLDKPDWNKLSKVANDRGFNLVVWSDNLPAVTGNFEHAAAASELTVVAGHTGRDSQTTLETNIPLNSGGTSLVQVPGSNYAGGNSEEVQFVGKALAVFGCNSDALPIDGMIKPTNPDAQFIGVKDVDGARASSVPANNEAAYAFVNAYVKTNGDLKAATTAAQAVYTASNNSHIENGRRIYDDRQDKVTSRPIQ